MPSQTVKPAHVAPRPARRPVPAAESRPRKQPRYNVILLDDDDHSYDYVIDLVQRLFARPREAGYLIALEVDTTGRAILLTTTLEHAELKRDQVHALGPDRRISACKGAMTAVIEPVESESE